ncbi:hypothetical protein CC80DRAFT_489535 [Byssothecium circinans]|uniref:F-box domain-containing protein n=1 Tax=Byssothecium circinans TaxID=147558 RepID=A0A6A5U638_9PLEO|nr:hypothetical protein CC80DRAFT_489535 [Byssothecium circinans]
MVNSTQAVFKVNKQTPLNAPPLPYSGVINYRKPGGKRAPAKTQRVRLIPGVDIEPDRKRKRDEGEHVQRREMSISTTVVATEAPARIPTATAHRIPPPKFRRGKVIGKSIDLDTWFTILSFSNPAQLLEMRTKIASCYRFLRDNPMLWKHSRSHYYHGTLPDPPSELTEFQYAHLRHGHGCMSCGTPSTRKTYWAFLRRWCKNCLQAKTVKEQDMAALMKDSTGEDLSYLQKCLPSAIFDSWGNFTGVGPATTHSLKTVYLKSDAKALVAEYERESAADRTTWFAEMRTWIANKQELVEERRRFADAMQAWEDNTRHSKSLKYQQRKSQRKEYFAEKASHLSITVREMECCPAYRRAIQIPKEANNTSWLQLKPKLEKEVADLRARAPSNAPVTFPFSGSSTPSNNFYI